MGKVGNQFTDSPEKKKQRVMAGMVAGIIAVVILIVLISIGDVKKDEVGTDIKLQISEYDNKVLLINDEISGYLKENPYNVSAEKIHKSYTGDKRTMNRGLPVTFSYDIQNLYTGIFVKDAELQIGESEYFTDAKVFSLEEKSIDIYSLKTNTKYYYSFKVTLSDNSILKETSSFYTEDTPRIMNVDGVVNVRDIGGWKAEDNKRIRQGLLYRGSELDGAVERYYRLSEKGLSEMINELKIKSEMDLRNPAVNEVETNILGNNVKHTYYNAPQYTDIFLPENKETLCKIFSDMANKDSYPVYLHCTYGKDRTGTVCAVLEALLGVSKEDIKRDYELSAFTYGTLNSTWFDDFINQLENFEGDTLQESAENYLLSIDVTEEEIENIKDIFLGE